MRNERTIKEYNKTKYEIKKIILNDNTELEINKIVHVALVKESQKGNQFDFKITYGAKTKEDLLALSNECSMLAHAFKFMREYNIDFTTACNMYDDYIEEAYKKLGKNESKEKEKNEN